jgi:RimJ/RimL family protein N-acetyltransferase
VIVETERLLLRPWRSSDRSPFASLNADPEVMQHFPAPMSRAASDEFADRIERHIGEHGWGLWAVEIKDADPFVGFIGLWPVGFDLLRRREPVEIGWRLARSAWGRGLATEGARAALEVAWNELGLDDVVSFTARTNTRSVAVMERIGMTFEAEFQHPRLPEGHPLRPHLLYRVDRPSERGGVGPGG